MDKQKIKEAIIKIINDEISSGEDNYGIPTDKTIENIADNIIQLFNKPKAVKPNSKLRTCRFCKCCNKVTGKRWNPVTMDLECITVQMCWCVQEPFVIQDLDKPCIAYPGSTYDDKKEN